MTKHEPIIKALPLAPWPLLPRLAARDAEFQRRLNNLSYHAKTSLHGVDITLTGPASAPNPQSCICVDVAVLEATIRVLAPRDLLARLAHLGGFTGELDQCAPLSRALVVEHLLEPALAPLETALGTDIRITDITMTPCAPEGPSLGLYVNEAGQKPIALALYGDLHSLQTIAEKIGDPAKDLKTFNIGVLPIDLSLTGPSFRIPAAECPRLKAGDGFFVEMDWTRLGAATVTIGGRFEAAARLEAMGFTLSERPRNIEKGTIMTEAPADAGLLDIMLSIELGQKRVPLAELKDMTVGYVLPFGDALPSHVSLSANGTPFAEADLVRIDDKVGLRLSQIL